MADVAVAMPGQDVSGALRTIVSGLVTKRRKFRDTFETVITAAAPDEYTAPTPLLVRSEFPIGKVGDKIAVQCRVGGFRGRAYDWRDKDSGEVRRVEPYHVTLDAIAPAQDA
jgi:hypothetical protein